MAQSAALKEERETGGASACRSGNSGGGSGGGGSGCCGSDGHESDRAERNEISIDGEEGVPEGRREATRALDTKTVMTADAGSLDGAAYAENGGACGRGGIGGGDSGCDGSDGGGGCGGHSALEDRAAEIIGGARPSSRITLIADIWHPDLSPG